MLPLLRPVRKSQYKKGSQKDIAAYLKAWEEHYQAKQIDGVQIGKHITVRGIAIEPESVVLEKGSDSMHVTNDEGFEQQQSNGDDVAAAEDIDMDDFMDNDLHASLGLTREESETEETEQFRNALYEDDLSSPQPISPSNSYFDYLQNDNSPIAFEEDSDEIDFEIEPESSDDPRPF
ncbi:hypothetical protein BDF20DRAFT_54555 [Mycotypha africana]|uniref:uncharacterized protein n=1 Tax=Mycotypha africana TaxID=64632 RepID=UPI0023014044|nr:uncharacterized protein BDF20DRAFT_54555 [Mycotypha africana]KAI8991650.1 hypothetical protein BDF20DRAFT_54555 [Mycotypha africana]